MTVAMTNPSAPWLLGWAVARTLGKPVPPGSSPKALHWEWLRYAQWRWFRSQGTAPPKPKNVRTPIPRSWYAPVAEYLNAMQGATPPPQPPLIGRFGKKGLWFAWPFHSSGWPPWLVAEKAARVGAKWITLDAGEPANLAQFQATVQACAALGIEAGLWGMIPSAPAAAQKALSVGSAFYIAQNEGMGQTEQDFPARFRAAAPGVSLALVASPWEGLPQKSVDPEGWRVWTKPWIDANVPVIAEAYLGSNPVGGTPALQAAQAAHRGWQVGLRAVVLEAYVGKVALSAYSVTEIRNPDNFATPKAASVYLCETMADPADYDWLAAL